MRRVVAAVAVLATLAAGALAIGAGSSQDAGGDRVDAIFDSASFLIPGQDVKIAGAKVGTVAGVVLTPDNKARIEMRIEQPGFVPFRADADCTIQPQSLIGEKFIQCTPGSSREPALVARGGHPPTVPLSNTHSPVDLDLVFATFRRPVNERLGLLVNELGSGLAARGGDLNEAIRRANPALQETNRVLKIVDGDRRNLQSLISASDDVLATLARRRERIGEFVKSARAVTETTADKRRQLGAAVQNLPPLLAQARPSLDSLTTLARQGTPLLRDLRTASPQLARLASDAKPLADAARPALTRLGSASVQGEETLAAAAPVVAKLRPFAAIARTTGPLVDELFQSLKQRGAIEGLQDFVYQATLTLARFDKVSHLVPPYLVGAGSCTSYATATVDGCDAHFAGGRTSRAARRRTTSTRSSTTSDRSTAPQRTATTPTAPTTTTTPSTATTTTPQATPPADAPTTITIPGLPPITLPSLGGGDQGTSGDDKSSDPVKGLLDTLLK